TVAGDGEAGRIYFQRGTLLADPQIGRPGIVCGSREFVLRRQAVIDGDDAGLRPGADVSGDDVVCVAVAEGVPAAVTIDDGREGPVALRPVHAHRTVAGRPLCSLVFRPFDGCGNATARLRHRVHH